MLNREEELRFCKARRAAIALDYQNLNPEQRRAALATDGPLLLLAGAGSGKTTVLIHRIANLMKYGRGSDCDEAPAWAAPADLAFLEGYVQNPDPAQKAEQERLCRVDPAVPWSIIAITFTNKAAGELKERLERMLGPSANDIWASTFHSACVRILRRDIDRLGFTSSFTIYDTADSERVIKDIVKDFNLDEKAFAPRSILGYISRAKDAMKLGKDYLQECEKAGDYRLVKIAKVYAEYERRLREANALDFDDIILDTVRLLQNFDDVREYYQKKFRYVLIDEYQDTNNLQYLLASTLAGGYENICVVGDDDQSIYRFRGATIENILSFESQYKGARVIRLEQNYRSTKNILEASNAVIRNNEGRKGKELWTEHEAGDKVHCYTAMNEHDEAQFVAAQILAGFSAGRGWRDHAVLYRMNAQSNQLEQAFKRNGIPYRIIGGIRFFDRAEVKDMMAYLCAVNNPNDDLRLSRIINNPPRGIGATTVERAQAIAQAEGRSLWDVVSHARDWPELQKAAPRLSQFAELMAELRKLSGEMELPDFYEELVQRTGYAVMLEQKNTVEDRTRLENVHEVLSSIQNYLENAVDERDLNRLICQTLERAGYSVDTCYDGEAALDNLLGAEYDCLLLDIMMPKKDGHAVLRAVRAQGGAVPVIFLTARDSVQDRIEGLDLGADDYLVKPFDFDELLARIRAATRKYSVQKTSVLTLADLTVDTSSRTVTRGGKEIRLSAKEYAILQYLMQHKGTVISRARLEDHIWNYDYAGGSNVVDVYITYLRKKIDGGFDKKLLHTVRGAGWILKEEP